MTSRRRVRSFKGFVYRTGLPGRDIAMSKAGKDVYINRSCYSQIKIMYRNFFFHRFSAHPII